MNLSQLTEYDTFLFHQGTNCRAYEMLGAHLTEANGEKGVRFIAVLSIPDSYTNYRVNIDIDAQGKKTLSV